MQKVAWVGEFFFRAHHCRCVHRAAVDTRYVASDVAKDRLTLMTSGKHEVMSKLLQDPHSTIQRYLLGQVSILHHIQICSRKKAGMFSPLFRSEQEPEKTLRFPKVKCLCPSNYTKDISAYLP